MQSEQMHSQLILIAERDQNVRRLQEYFLDQAGYQVEFAGDGETALAQARQRVPVLVITEILIPKLDGLALCRQLRADPLTRGIPVIVFSILAARARAEEAGATVFMRKPLVDTTFVAAVQSLTAARSNGVQEK